MLSPCDILFKKRLKFSIRGKKVEEKNEIWSEKIKKKKIPIHGAPAAAAKRKDFERQTERDCWRFLSHLPPVRELRVSNQLHSPKKKRKKKILFCMKPKNLRREC